MKKFTISLANVNRNVAFGKSYRIICLIILILSFNFNLFSQVTFTQTTTDDFIRGHADNTVISGGNVYLSTKADAINPWLTTTILPEMLTGHRIETWRSYVFLSGGYDGTDYSNSVFKATLQSGGISNWSTLNSLPVTLRDHAIVAAYSHLYVLGGRTNGAPSDQIYYASINSDGTIGNWQHSPVTLPQPLWGHTVEFVGGNIYVAGGTNQSGEDSAIDSVFSAKINPFGGLSEFSPITNLPEARNGHSMVTYGGKLYIIGGYDNTGTKKNSVYYSETHLDGTCSAWLSATSLSTAISNHSSTCYNGILTVMCGDNGTIYSNKIWYANIDNTPSFTWNMSSYYYVPNKNGQAFASNGKIFYSGGEALSGFPIDQIRYAPLNLTSEKVHLGEFISYPFTQLGANRDISSLTYNITFNATYNNYEIYYRVAGNDTIWGDWFAEGQNNPVNVGLNKRFVQYLFKFDGDDDDNIVFHDLTVNISGYTELSGNLNSIGTLTLANSPYWATNNISFTSGTHTIEAGVVIMFSPCKGLEIGQTNIFCTGTVSDSVYFIPYTNDTYWNGIYFNDLSDEGVSSQFDYTVIEKGGCGDWNANLYCYNSSEPLIMNCTFREADGHGIRLVNAQQHSIMMSEFIGNIEDGVRLNNSTPFLTSINIYNNEIAGITLHSNSDPNLYACNSSNNKYGIYLTNPDRDIPVLDQLTLENNVYNGVVLAGGTISHYRHWPYYNYNDYGYYLIGNITIGKYQDTCRVTVEPNVTVAVDSGYRIQVGQSNYGGELYAVGTADSVITFTSFNGLPGGWNGIYFHDHSDAYGSESAFEYCTIENGNGYNLYCHNTNQPSTVFNCIVRNSANIGIKFYSSSPTISNSQILNNGSYSIYFTNFGSNPILLNNIIEGDIGHGGGTLGFNATLPNYGVDYVVLGDITIHKSYDNPRLTIEPGNMIKFDSGVGLTIGHVTAWNYGG
ncbi:MAG: right-handed parallel beta-helix repeat-containing protein, partial [Bacteroidales bacterium]|nr:right-handed parallel beta-helix repeat-containing protein [Bacteroidales bacterium]